MKRDNEQRVNYANNDKYSSLKFRQRKEVVESHDRTQIERMSQLERRVKRKKQKNIIAYIICLGTIILNIVFIITRFHPLYPSGK